MKNKQFEILLQETLVLKQRIIDYELEKNKSNECLNQLVDQINGNKSKNDGLS